MLPTFLDVSANWCLFLLIYFLFYTLSCVFIFASRFAFRLWVHYRTTYLSRSDFKKLGTISMVKKNYSILHFFSCLPLTFLRWLGCTNVDLFLQNFPYTSHTIKSPVLEIHEFVILIHIDLFNVECIRLVVLFLFSEMVWLF